MPPPVGAVRLLNTHGADGQGRCSTRHCPSPVSSTLLLQAHAMKHPDADAAGSSHAATDPSALQPTAFVASGVDDGSDVETWVGYEALHPLTWVPLHGPRGST